MVQASKQAKGTIHSILITCPKHKKDKRVCIESTTSTHLVRGSLGVFL
ncbi:hypothetical protein NC651_029003 [Populus alba x Populus x berolinensis]|nr:hypothetical protein NC651_029003 [Populus alba x Populus x berolinensis]